MKKFFIFFIASILLISFPGVSFSSINARHSEASTDKITSINISQNQITILNKKGVETTFNVDASQLALSVMASDMNLQDFSPLSKCNKSEITITDKKSIMKASPFKSNMELFNSHLKAAGLNKTAVDDIYNFNTAAKETIHKTYLVTLMSFLL
jgi:hypothetical protein